MLSPANCRNKNFVSSFPFFSKSRRKEAVANMQSCNGCLKSKRTPYNFTSLGVRVDTTLAKLALSQTLSPATLSRIFKSGIYLQEMSSAVYFY